MIGLQIKTGFTQNVKNLIGGKVGCTHLVEMMRSIATTAFQALYPDRDKLNLNSNESNRPKLLNSCYSWSESSRMIQENFLIFIKKMYDFLNDVRVLDLTRLLPGPVCTHHLSEFGAEVIKIEDIDSGDYAEIFQQNPPIFGQFFTQLIVIKKLQLTLKQQ